MKNSTYRVFPKDCSQWSTIQSHFPDGIPCDKVTFNQTGVFPDSLYGWKIDFFCCFPVQIEVLQKLLKRHGVLPENINQVEVIIPGDHVEKAMTKEGFQINCQDVWRSQITGELV